MRLARAELGPDTGRIRAVDLAAWTVFVAATPVASVVAAGVAQSSSLAPPSVAFVVCTAMWILLGRLARLELSWDRRSLWLARRFGPLRWSARRAQRSEWTVGLHASRGVTSLVLFGPGWSGAPLTVITSSFHRVDEGVVRAWAGAAQVPVDAQQVAAPQSFP